MKGKSLIEKIEYLSSFMTDERFAVIRSTLDSRTDYIAVCLENTFHPHNASAVIRSCEAFGIQDIHVVETLVRFSPSVDIVKGTQKWVDLHRYGDEANPSSALISRLKGDGYRIVATSPHAGDKTPEEFDVAAGKFALFFGTEKDGITEEVLENADEFIRIPMYGFVESLNISVCAAILLHILSEKVRREVDGWQIGEPRRTEILYRWMMASVRDSKNIIKRFESQR